MFEKNMRIAYLLDVYSEVLDEHTKSIMKAYYEDDLSLSEIALDENISRQGVRHVIKKGEEQLDFLDEKLKLSKLYLKIEEHIEELSEISFELLKSDDKSIKDYAKRIDESLKRLDLK